MRPNRYVYDHELKQFWDSFRPTEERQKLACLLMAFCGLRPSEAVRVRYHDFAPDLSILKVFNTKVGRKDGSKKPRVDIVVVPSFLRPIIKNYFAGNYLTFREGYIFPTLGHGCKNPHMNKIALQAWFCQRRKELGWTDIAYEVNFQKKNQIHGSTQRVHRQSLYSLRRWFVTQSYVNSGNDLLFAMSLARHVKVDTTQRYVNCYQFFDRAPQVVEKMGEFFDDKLKRKRGQRGMEDFLVAK